MNIIDGFFSSDDVTVLNRNIKNVNKKKIGPHHLFN